MVTNELPPAPAGRSATVAAFTPVPVLDGLLQGALTGVLVAVWAGSIGARTWALGGVLVTAGLGSLWLHVYENREWVGHDWIASRGFGPTMVVDLADIGAADVPAQDVGPTDLVVAHRNGRVVRVDLGHLYRDPAFGAAVLALLERAERAGADVAPGVRQLANDLERAA